MTNQNSVKLRVLRASVFVPEPLPLSQPRIAQDTANLIFACGKVRHKISVTAVLAVIGLPRRHPQQPSDPIELEVVKNGAVIQQVRPPAAKTVA
mgnify:CR=1 FL=1